MTLPFAAAAVTADGTPIDWMHSKTDAKGLWICNFDKEEDSADEANLLAEYMGKTLCIRHFVGQHSVDAAYAALRPGGVFPGGKGEDYYDEHSQHGEGSVNIFLISDFQCCQVGG